jgi:nicotinamidase-related amidase
MDYQVGIVASYGAGDPELVERAAAVITAAREQMPVIYVQVAYRPGHPEIGRKNARLAGAIKARDLFVADADMTAIHPRVKPARDDMVVTKRRISAFYGTDLDLILRAQQIDSLVLFGIATSGVVLSTVRHAFDADYDITVVEDCCIDADTELHRVLLDKVVGRQAKLVRAASFSA